MHNTGQLLFIIIISFIFRILYLDFYDIGFMKPEKPESQLHKTVKAYLVIKKKKFVMISVIDQATKDQ